MPKTPPLWASGSRKEVSELLRSLWSRGGPEVRARLAQALVAGPPDHLLEHIDEEERAASRDRRIFDRLSVIERVGEPLRDPTLRAESARLRRTYPHWRAHEGERGDFGTWIEVRSGPDKRYGSDDLMALSDHQLIDVLVNEQEMREGLLDSWRQLSADQPARAVEILEQLKPRDPPAPTDVWGSGLRGLRDAARQPAGRERLMTLLETLAPVVFNQPEVSRAIVDILKSAAEGEPSPTRDEGFWRVFDLATVAVGLDASNNEAPNDQDWVSLAINRSGGDLAAAFFAALFDRDLKVGDGIPHDLLSRLDELIAPGAAGRRPARVIAASRLSFLFAVDPTWTKRKLIPNLNWARDEVEALAAWQGYLWQARIDRKLWSEIRSYFISSFRPEFLQQIGDFSRNLAQLLMLIGIEFGIDEVSREEARNAIRAMPSDMRAEALAWVASFLEQAKLDAAGMESGSRRNVDILWAKRVKPWLLKVWPNEQHLRSAPESEQFALIAVHTDKEFPDAVRTIQPYLQHSDVSYVLHKLAESSHPDVHPSASLDLLNAIAEAPAIFDVREISNILERIRSAQPQIAQTATFRTWDEWLRTRW
jgi:hypothetical protein